MHQDIAATDGSSPQRAEMSQRVPNTAYSPSDSRMAELWGNETRVSQQTALSQSAFFSGVVLIAESMASIPIKVYKQTKGGTWEHIYDHPVQYAFGSAINDWMTPSVWKSVNQTHLLMSGGAVSTIARNGRGQGIALKSFLPINTRYYIQRDGSPQYSLRDAPYSESDDLLISQSGAPYGEFEYYNYDEVLHHKAFGVNGYTGYSVLKLARSTLQLNSTIDAFGHKFFNKGRPAGFLTKDGNMQGKQKDLLKDEWHDLQEGVQNAFNVGILSGGLKWQPIGYTNEDAQYLQSRSFQILEIARWLRIPPHMLGHLDKATNSNIEQLMLEFITFTLAPWLCRSEEEINLKMFTRKERSLGYQVFYDVDCFLRGDSKTRATVEEMDLRNGVRTIDEIRNNRKMPVYDAGIGSKPLIMASQLDTLENVIAGTSPLQGNSTTSTAEVPKETQ
jgi:HK97 family phage portal protein